MGEAGSGTEGREGNLKGRKQKGERKKGEERGKEEKLDKGRGKGREGIIRWKREFQWDREEMEE